MTEDDATLIAALRRMGLIGETERPRVTALEGGVSSNILRVETDRTVFCVKQALPRLRVAREWTAPIERNFSEIAWIELAGRINPSAVPKLLGSDRTSSLFAMEYLDPLTYPNWKVQLSDGVIELATAEAVASLILSVHRATAHDRDVAGSFGNDHIFHPIRIEPYLLATAEIHDEIASVLRSIAQSLAETKIALVHGDISPKNILVGPNGPVLLDAECACYGDPAFDLAFCLNHLLLKCVWRPRWTERYLEAFDTLAATYLAGVDWEDRVTLDARAARLLAAFLIARIDGKSPVEYIVADDERNQIRRAAIRHLNSTRPDLAAIRASWQSDMTP